MDTMRIMRKTNLLVGMFFALIVMMGLGSLDVAFAQTCETEQDIINFPYLGGCGYTNTQTFTLNQSAIVTRIRIWHYPNITGTTTPSFNISGPDGYRFSGTTTQGTCFAGWCEAWVSMNQGLLPGAYTLTISASSICENPSGQTTLIVYGCYAPVPSRVEAVPTMSVWGMLIFVMGAGFGAVRYLTIRKRGET